MIFFAGVDIYIPVEFIILFYSYFMSDICDLVNGPLLILHL
jgi:hypothetical protein